MLLSLALLVVAYSAVLVLLWFNQDRLLFPAPPFAQAAPAGFEPVALRAADGVATAALYLPGPEAGSPGIVFFHGNGSLALTETERALALRDAGFAVLLAEYRGYGGSEGAPSEAGLVADGLAAFDWMQQRTAQPPHLYAHSLGTGVAVAVAAQRKVASVVLEAPYSSIADVAADRYPWAPVRWLIRNPFRSDLRIASVDAPMLMMHGDADTVVPIRYGRRLRDLARDPQWVEFPGAQHGLEATDAIARAVAFFRSR